jgi:hypothetical protein
VTCDLFSQLARDVADQLGYPYLDADEAKMTRYLDLVRKLPRMQQKSSVWQWIPMHDVKKNRSV